MNPTRIPQKSHLLYQARQGTKRTQGKRVVSELFRMHEQHLYLFLNSCQDGANASMFSVTMLTNMII